MPKRDTWRLAKLVLGVKACGTCRIGETVRWDAEASGSSEKAGGPLLAARAFLPHQEMSAGELNLQRTLPETDEPHRLTRRARWLVVIAAVLWSTSGLFAKAPLLSTWPLEQRGVLLAFWRTLFAGLFLLPFIRRPQWTWWLIPSTLLFAVMSVSYLTAMTRTTAANAIWLQNTAPLWVFVLGVGLFRERVQRADWWMLLAVALGLGLILACEWRACARGRHGWMASYGQWLPGCSMPLWCFRCGPSAGSIRLG